MEIKEEKINHIEEEIKDLEYIVKEENIAGKLAKGFIQHPLTLVLAIFILAVGYMALNLTPREENPQIKVAGGAVIVPMPGATASEIQKVIIEPLERKIRGIKGVENIFSIAKESVGIIQVQYYIGEDKAASDLKLYDQIMRNMDLFNTNLFITIVPFHNELKLLYITLENNGSFFFKYR